MTIMINYQGLIIFTSLLIKVDFSFMWIRTEEMTPMVDLFTVYVQLYQGNMEKVTKYSEKALVSLDSLKYRR